EHTFSQAMELRQRLGALMQADTLFVTAVLAVPFAWVEFSGPQRNVWVLHQDDLARPLEGAPKRLSGQQVEAYVKALELLAASARDIMRTAARAGFAP